MVMKVMGGDMNACPDRCLMPAGFAAQYEVLWASCMKLNPRNSHVGSFAVSSSLPSVLDVFGGDPDHGPLLWAAADTCDAVEAGFRRLGAPADTTAWREAITGIAASLEPRLQVERARDVAP